MSKRRLTRRTMLQATGVATVSALAGCGGGGGGGDSGSGDGGNGNSGADQTIIVSSEDPHYDPQEVTVSVGDTVVWEARSNQHYVRVDSKPAESTWSGLTSNTINTGETYSHTFEVAGDYEYSCFYHNRAASITVTE